MPDYGRVPDYSFVLGWLSAWLRPSAGLQLRAGLRLSAAGLQLHAELRLRAAGLQLSAGITAERRVISLYAREFWLFDVYRSV